jgi:hypothetical protein
MHEVEDVAKGLLVELSTVRWPVATHVQRWCIHQRAKPPGKAVRGLLEQLSRACAPKVARGLGLFGLRRLMFGKFWRMVTTTWGSHKTTGGSGGR